MNFLAKIKNEPHVCYFAYPITNNGNTKEVLELAKKINKIYPLLTIILPHLFNLPFPKYQRLYNDLQIIQKVDFVIMPKRFIKATESDYKTSAGCSWESQYCRLIQKPIIPLEEILRFD